MNGIEGIWKIQMLGIYDWETTGTAFLQDGKYWAGGNDHYTVGTYTFDGSEVIVDATIFAYKNTQAIFGKKCSQYKLRYYGQLEGDVIKGEAKDGKNPLMGYQATRVADLP